MLSSGSVFGYMRGSPPLFGPIVTQLATQAVTLARRISAMGEGWTSPLADWPLPVSEFVRVPLPRVRTKRSAFG